VKAHAFLTASLSHCDIPLAIGAVRTVVETAAIGDRHDDEISSGARVGDRYRPRVEMVRTTRLSLWPSGTSSKVQAPRP